MKIKIAWCLLGLVLCGCNTMQGLGKDVQKGGQALQKVASGT